MNVHVNRIPISGRVNARGVHARALSPRVTARDAGSTNERSEIWIEHNGQTIVARQIVGLLARARRVPCAERRGRARG